jgi:hypothetical protein
MDVSMLEEAISSHNTSDDQRPVALDGDKARREMLLLAMRQIQQGLVPGSLVMPNSASDEQSR